MKTGREIEAEQAALNNVREHEIEDQLRGRRFGVVQVSPQRYILMRLKAVEKNLTGNEHGYILERWEPVEKNITWSKARYLAQQLTWGKS